LLHNEGEGRGGRVYGRRTILGKRGDLRALMRSLKVHEKTDNASLVDDGNLFK